MPITIRLAVRDWDHVVPLLTGAIASDDVRLQIESRSVTPDLLLEHDLDGAETSLSRYALARLAADDRMVGLPVFLMRGFRQRCVLVERGSSLRRLDELAGRRVGLTGWPDSGNTWTRALLRDAGVDLAAVQWSVGSMDGSPVDAVRLGTATSADDVTVLTAGRSLPAALRAGELDAVLTPFMPEGHFTGRSGLRHLLEDYPADELDYFRSTGFVPGIHLLALRRETVDRHPWLPSAVIDLFQRSKQQWWARRRAMADTTPWLLHDLERTAGVFGEDWMPYGYEENRAMVETFSRELFAQGIAPRVARFDELFASGDDGALVPPAIAAAGGSR